jgi:(p)ppGpp synthase/HD superfamily hydrolase
MNAERFKDALKLARKAHHGQVRKDSKNKVGVDLPFITHVVAVAAAVQHYDGSEDQVLGGLLHDALEDAGAAYREKIGRFGPTVLDIVEFCSDTVVEHAQQEKPAWLVRKKAYIDHLRQQTQQAREGSAPHAGILVSACDKLVNLQALVIDHIKLGDALFAKFSASKPATLWYYEQLVQAYRGAVPAALEQALERELAMLLQLSAVVPPLPEPVAD